MRLLIKAIVMIFLFFMAGCNDIPEEIATDVSSGANPWTHLEFNNAADDFQFAIVTDRTGECRSGVFAGAMDKINLLQPEFVVSVGDLISGYTIDEKKLDEQWQEFGGFVDRLEMPFFYVPGNHDITNEVMLEKWDQLFGRSYYHFVYNNVLFLCLNTEDPPDPLSTGNFSDRQIRYFEKVLEDNPDVSWTFLFMHKPLWGYGEESMSLANLENMLEGRQYSVFAGHYHDFKKTLRKGREYYILGTTGGGSPLKGPLYGQLDHITWVSMTKDGPRVANLALNGIFESEVLGVFDLNPFYDIKTNQAGDELSFSLEIENPLAVDMNIHIGWVQDHSSYWVVRSEYREAAIKPGTKEIIKFTADANEQGDFLPLPTCKVKFATTLGDGDGILRLPVDLDSYLLKHRPNLLVRRCETRPVIDGKIDDEIWHRKPDVPSLDVQSWENPTDIETEVWLAYDQDSIYLAMRCGEPLMNLLKNNVTERDGRVWQDDSFEVLLDTNRDRKSYYQFMVNSNGVVYDIFSTDRSYNAHIESVASKEDDCWVVEMSIPWDDLEVAEPLGTAKMGFLFARTRRTEGYQVLQYPYVNGGNHRVEFYGNLSLE